MKLKIHRGAQEIGGSCIEIWTESTRIILDIGMPLVNRDRTEFDSRQIENKSIMELLDEKILPNIPGLYHESVENKVNAVFISHPHQDHYGLGRYVKTSIPFYLGEAGHDLINLTRIFIRRGLEIQNPIHFKNKDKIIIGNLTITPYLNDHSAFDTYGFLIEGDGKKIYYTSDFRDHGRKPWAFSNLLATLPKHIDYLIMEGTNVGQPGKKVINEIGIENKMIEAFKGTNKLAILQTSGQNIDRLVSIFRAVIQSERSFVVDIYTAAILEKLVIHRSSLPRAGLKGRIKVLFSGRQAHWYLRTLEENGYSDIIEKLVKHPIKTPEIDLQPFKYVMLVRPGFENILDRMDTKNSGIFIYSLWSGYLKQRQQSEFVDYLKKRNFGNPIQIHTSGHADVETLQKLVNTIQPKQIIPNHTFSPDEYQKLFNSPVKELKDGELLNC